MATDRQDLVIVGSPRIIYDRSLTGSAENNLNSGAATLYGKRVINSDSVANYSKAWNNAAPTVGTTAPNLAIKAIANEDNNYLFLGGLRFDTAYSIAGVTAGGTGGVTNPAGTMQDKSVID